MPRRRLIRASSLFGLGLALGTAALGAEDDPRSAAVDQLLAASTQPDAPGGTLMVYQDGQVVCARAFGLADLEQGTPLRPETIFHVASVSKQFTAMAVALLAREGKIDLEADIRRYLPDVPDFGHVITVQHLLHHTSGLRDQWSLFVLGGKDMRDVLQQGQILNLVRRQRELNFAPGTEYNYSNTNYTLLGEIVRRVSGRTLREFAEERIFRPLGMTHTFFYDDVAELVPGRANSYQYDAARKVWRRRPLNYANVGATSLHTTVLDLAKWAGNFQHPVVGDAALIAQITTPGQLADGSPINYAFALRHYVFAGWPAIAHTGRDAAFQSLFVWFPDRNLALAVFVNRDGLAPLALAEKLAEIYLGRGTAAASEPPEAAADAATLQALAGFYAHPWRPLIELRSAGTQLEAREGPQPPEALRFRSDGSFGSGARERGYFEPVRDAAGRVVALDRVVPFDRSRIRYERSEPKPPTPADLQELAGRYRCPELDLEYTLAVAGDRLELASLWTSPPLQVVPRTADRLEFTAPLMRETVLTVQREGGRVTGFRLHADRLRHVRFDRLEAGTAP